MMNWSLKAKLAAFVALAAAILAAGCSLLIWHLATRAESEKLDVMLRSPGRRLAEQTTWNTDWEKFDRSLRLVFGESWEENGICRVVGRGPRYEDYYSSSDWPEDIALQYPSGTDEPEMPTMSAMSRDDELLTVREPLLYSVEALDGRRFRMVNLANRDLTIHLGVREDLGQESLGRLKAGLLSGSVVLVAMMTLLAWFVAMRSLRPVESIAETAAEIGSKHLARRIELAPGADVEFRQLVDVLNRMFGRLERNFHQANRFSADASHELKTPVTNLVASVSERINRASPESGEQEFLGGVMNELDRIRSVLGGLLLLSRADGGLLQLTKEPVGLLELLEEVAIDASTLATEAGLAFRSDFSGLDRSESVLGDEVMLTQAFHNLLRNAVLYNQPAGEVAMIVWLDKLSVILRVENTGEPIPEELTAEVFDRFRKGKGGCSGLGLSLVREIVEAHGGSVELVSNGPEIAFEVRLPRAGF